MRYRVTMTSEEYGTEYFDYDSLEEAEAGLGRLLDSVRQARRVDGVARLFSLEELDDDDDDDDDKDDRDKDADG